MNRLHSFLFGGAVMALAAVLSMAMAQQPAATVSPSLSQPVPAMSTADMVFAAWDSDKNHALSPEEFKAGWTRLAQAAALRRLKTQFDRHDANRSGAIDPAEYASLEVLRNTGAAAPAMTRFDADKDGSLSFKEYVALVAALAQPKALPKQ